MDVGVIKSDTSPPHHSVLFNPFDFFYYLPGNCAGESHVIELLL